MKKILIYIFSIFALLFASCTEYDNYDAPKSKLHGKIHVDGQQIGVRNAVTKLELYQDGYELKDPIEVYIAQDGTYSALLFNGEYKLVRKAVGPWVNLERDTLLLTVKGNTEFDVEMQPHFIVKNDSYTVDMVNKKVVGTFTVDKITSTSNLSNVRMYIGPRVILDNDRRGSYKKAEPADVIFGKPMSITMDITDDLITKGYMYVRVGAKAAESDQYAYTLVHKIELK